MSEVTRRDLLKLAGTALLSASGLLGLAGLFRFLDYEADPPPQTVFDLGPAAAYPPGTRTMLAVAPAVLVHDQTGLSALSLVCTHLGCTVQESDNGFSCPCHASAFDRRGRVTKGPAGEPLRSLCLETTAAGHLLLHLD